MIMTMTSLVATRVCSGAFITWRRRSAIIVVSVVLAAAAAAAAATVFAVILS